MIVDSLRHIITPEMYKIVTFTSHIGNEQTIWIDGKDFELINEVKEVYGIYIEQMAVADVRQLITCTAFDTSVQLLRVRQTELRTILPEWHHRIICLKLS